jgi:hypothetical protein
MEFFPSAGRSQWPVIEESIAAADFCLFIVAGRYGSISDNGLSWTHREFRRAVELGKPIGAMLHSEPGSLPLAASEATPEAREQLAAFREEVEDHTVCRYFRDEADLVEAATSSVLALRDSGALVGWFRATPEQPLPVQPHFDRNYEALEIDWTLSPSTTAPDTVDAMYRGRRRLVCKEPAGLGYCAIDFARGNERHLPFDGATVPQLELTSSERTGDGVLRLDAPRKKEGSTFVQDALFRPPLALDEVADFVIAGRFPAYKYRYRDQILTATADARGGARTYEWVSRRIAFPTGRLVLGVFLPDELDAMPYGPLVGWGATSTDHALSAELRSSGAYEVRRTTRDGVEGVEMSLRVERPALLLRYRLAWELPDRT